MAALGGDHVVLTTARRDLKERVIAVVIRRDVQAMGVEVRSVEPVRRIHAAGVYGGSSGRSLTSRSTGRHPVASEESGRLGRRCKTARGLGRCRCDHRCKRRSAWRPARPARIDLRGISERQAAGQGSYSLDRHTSCSIWAVVRSAGAARSRSGVFDAVAVGLGSSPAAARVGTPNDITARPSNPITTQTIDDLDTVPPGKTRKKCTATTVPLPVYTLRVGGVRLARSDRVPIVFVKDNVETGVIEIAKNSI